MPAPKEQPPPETLRQKDQGRSRHLWKAGVGRRRLTDGVSWFSTSESLRSQGQRGADRPWSSAGR